MVIRICGQERQTCPIHKPLQLILCPCDGRILPSHHKQPAAQSAMSSSRAYKAGLKPATSLRLAWRAYTHGNMHGRNLANHHQQPASQSALLPSRTYEANLKPAISLNYLGKRVLMPTCICGWKRRSRCFDKQPQLIICPCDGCILPNHHKRPAAQSALLDHCNCPQGYMKLT